MAATDLDPDYVDAMTASVQRPFIAYAMDSSGFVYTMDEVQEWCADPDKMTNEFGLEDNGFSEIVVGCGTAVEFRKAGCRLRGPVSHAVRDHWVERDVFGSEADEVSEYARQAQSIAAALNAGHVTPS